MEGRIPVFKPAFGEEEKQALCQTLDSGWVGRGPRTVEFEERFAEFVGVNNAVAVERLYELTGSEDAETRRNAAYYFGRSNSAAFWAPVASRGPVHCCTLRHSRRKARAGSRRLARRAGR